MSTQMKTPNTKQLNVYFNGFDWVVASSQEDALLAYREHTGEDYVSDLCGTIEDWFPLPDDDPLGIWQEDEPVKEDLPNGALVSRKNGNYRIEARCKEWVLTHGRGFLCSTEW